MHWAKKIMRLLFRLLITCIAAYTMAFVYLMPMIISGFLNNHAVETWLHIFLILPLCCYATLNLNWLFDAEVKSNYAARIGLPLFIVVLILGLISTAGLGLIFTFPTIIFSFYLIHWNNRKYEAYLAKVEYLRVIEEKAKKYDEYQKSIEEFEAEQLKLRSVMTDDVDSTEK